ncbi:MAG: DUF2207 domain-containing protein [Pseudomonadota bacterium]
MLLRWMFLLWCVSGAVAADERILSFDSDITVQGDGAMIVEETIRVRAEGGEIKRGIYRDFPTDYKDRYGNRYRVGFEVLQVLRDGSTEDHRTEGRGNGVRVYIGHQDRFLRTGEYIYTLRYRTDRQLGFFADHDELYWNVTGNGWAFPIDSARAWVRLPGLPPDAITQEAYTGYSGEQGRDYLADLTVDGLAYFETTRPLRPEEGLTIVTMWPKGYVTAPSETRQLEYFLDDNRAALIGFLGIAAILGYYLWIWSRVGRDPPAGVIFPRYEPPAHVSPAALRFVHRMGYDKKAFATAVVNLAVKGLVEISDEDDDYAITRTQKPATDVSPGERAILDCLPPRQGRLVLQQANHRIIRLALEQHEQALKRDYEKTYFLTNTDKMIPGALLSIAVLIAIAWSLPAGEPRAFGLFMLAWLSIWSVGVILLVLHAWNRWRLARVGGGIFAAVFTTLFALPFVGAEIGALVGLFINSGPILPVLLVAVITANALFYHWLKAPTMRGRRFLDEVEGLRLYLEVAEKDELNFKHPPAKTPELFERLLPYAMALDVEQHWAEKFASTLDRIGPEGEAYQPAWYRGRHWDSGHLGAFATTVGGALSNAIAASSTAPGSSSGGGGGGSSGGGGGGGGGGGW